jgi:hypothetical protein
MNGFGHLCDLHCGANAIFCAVFFGLSLMDVAVAMFVGKGNLGDSCHSTTRCTERVDLWPLRPFIRYSEVVATCRKSDLVDVLTTVKGGGSTVHGKNMRILKLVLY